MSPSNAHRKWLQELAVLQEIDIIQTAQQAERNKLLAQSRLNKPPQECLLSQEEMWEMHEAMLRDVEENEKQKSRNKADLLTLKRLVAEHKDCITCPVCLTEPSPPSPPQHQPYPQQLENKVWESSVGNIKSLESFNITNDSFST